MTDGRSTPTRKRILAALRKDPNMHMGQLKKAAKIASKSVVSYHLNKLIAEGKISKQARYIVHELGGQ